MQEAPPPKQPRTNQVKVQLVKKKQLSELIVRKKQRNKTPENNANQEGATGEGVSRGGGPIGEEVSCGREPIGEEVSCGGGPIGEGVSRGGGPSIRGLGLLCDYSDSSGDSD